MSNFKIDEKRFDIIKEAVSGAASDDVVTSRDPDDLLRK